MAVSVAEDATRSTFEEAIRDRGIDPHDLNVVLTLPSNNSVLAAVRAGVGGACYRSFWSLQCSNTDRCSPCTSIFPRDPFSGCGRRNAIAEAADALLEAIKSHDAQPDWVI